jgi:hypothetical protein
MPEACLRYVAAAQLRRRVLADGRYAATFRGDRPGHGARPHPIMAASGSTVREEVQTRPSIGEHGLVVITRPEVDPPPSTRWPLVVGVSAGTDWQTGDRRSLDWCWAQLTAALGDVCYVQCSPRPASASPWPAPLDDVVAVLKWLRSNADTYRLDWQRCALFGSSAGAHLAALVATRCTRSTDAIAGSASDLLRQIPTIRAALCYGGVMDLVSLYDAGGSPTYLHYFIGSKELKAPVAVSAMPTRQRPERRFGLVGAGVKLTRGGLCRPF